MGVGPSISWPAGFFVGRARGWWWCARAQASMVNCRPVLGAEKPVAPHMALRNPRSRGAPRLSGLGLEPDSGNPNRSGSMGPEGSGRVRGHRTKPSPAWTGGGGQGSPMSSTSGAGPHTGGARPSHRRSRDRALQRPGPHPCSSSRSSRGPKAVASRDPPSAPPAQQTHSRPQSVAGRKTPSLHSSGSSSCCSCLDCMIVQS